MRTFTKDTELSEWGRETALARHAMYEFAFILFETSLFTNRHGVTYQTTLLFMTNTDQTRHQQTAAQAGQVTKNMGEQNLTATAIRLNYQRNMQKRT
jgi:hypothetical protein